MPDHCVMGRPRFPGRLGPCLDQALVFCRVLGRVHIVNSDGPHRCRRLQPLEALTMGRDSAHRERRAVGAESTFKLEMQGDQVNRN